MSKTAFFPHTAQSLVWGLQKVSREVKYNLITACMLRNFSRVPLFSFFFFFCNPMNSIAWQASLSMGFSSQEYRRELPCPPPRDLLDPGIEPKLVMCPALVGKYFTASTTWEAQCNTYLRGKHLRMSTHLIFEIQGSITGRNA